MKRWVIIVSVITATAICNANLVINSGFEDGDNLNKIPDSFGEWAGKNPCAVVGPQDNITPFDGSHMLQFLNTGNNESDAFCDINQLIDLAPYKDIISTGNATISAVAWFNRIYVDNETDTGFGISVSVFSGEVSSWYDQVNNGTRLKGMSSYLYSDAAKMSWEAAGIQFSIPTNADFAEVHLFAFEDVYNDLISAEEFDGHYADNISLLVTPEPTTLILLGFGTLAFRKRK